MATGTITTCAAMKQADIKTAAPSFKPSLDFSPTSGSIAALAKWNSTTEMAKNRDPPVAKELGDADDLTLVFLAVVGPTGEVVVDVPLTDQEDGDGSRSRHPGDEQEQRAVSEDVRRASRQDGCDDVPAVVERLVSPGASCHGRPTDEAQSQGRNSRREDRCRRADRRLRRDNDHERWHRVEHDTANGD